MNSQRAWAVLWMVLTPAQRRRGVLLQIVALFMALSTVVSLAAVMTFLAVLTDPAFVQAHAPLAWAARHLGAGRDFVLILGASFIGLLILSAALNLWGLGAMGRFAHSVGDRIREALFADYLRREYLFHARTGSARLLDDVLYQADRLTHTLVSAQLLITNAALTLLVVVSIAIASPRVALFGVLAVAGCYWLFYRLMRWRLSRHGATVSRMGAERTAIAEQAFLGIKYLLIARAQRTFDQRFHAATRALSSSLSETNLIGQSPRYLLECVAGATLIGCAAIAGGGTMGGAWLAQLSFIAFAGFRLLPAVQQMYQASVVIRANRAVIENLAAQLARRAATPAAVEPAEIAPRPTPLRSVQLVEVGFRYSPDSPWVLDGASLRIEAGAAIGIVGASGCGKTTVVDVLAGLLTPVRGRVEIDGQALDAGRVAAWQRNIGYVPQEVLILDATVRENIAFGVEPANIDDERVRAAALQAGASSFIEALPGGFLARTSGLGGSLSGGQRQRLGLARALYRDPALLVLDEATNSLDAETERSIIDLVIRNRGSRTVVVVAHGAAAIGACDRVYELSAGRLQERRAAGERAPRRMVVE